MVLDDKRVCEILENSNEKAYKYGKLKPKIDKLMLELSNELEKEYNNKLKLYKQELIKCINEL